MLGAIPWQSRVRCLPTSGLTAAFLLRLALFSCVVGSSALAAARAQERAADSRAERLYNEAKAAEASGDLTTAVAKYDALLSSAPRLAPAYNNLGALYLRMREFRKAIDVLQKGLSIDPKMSSASAMLGIALYESGDYAAAKVRLESTLHNKPDDNNVELFLANDLIKLGDLDSAASHLQHLATRQPKNQEVWYLLGKVHMKLSERALGHLNEIDPNSVWVHQISGEVMESMKNYDGALLEYRKAVELAPRQPGVHFLLGNAYWALAMWSDSVKEFQAELAIDPANCSALWKIGNAMLEQRQDPDAARTHLDQALGLCPNLVQAKVDRARALIRLERNEEAITDLRSAEKISPEEPTIHFLLGQSLRAVGRLAESKAEMDIFAKLEESGRAANAEHARQVLENKTKPTPEN
jgi:tetratricopeptide (TPR) repeat protein